MAVKLRLKQHGKKHRGEFRLAVMDVRSPRDGRAIEELGIYRPHEKDPERKFKADLGRCRYWLERGAQVSETVENALKRIGFKYGQGRPTVENNHEIQDVVPIQELDTTNGLNLGKNEDRINTMMPRRANSGTASRADTARSSDVLIGPIHPSMTKTIQDRVLHLTSEYSVDGCLAPLEKGLARQVFVDAADRPLKEAVKQALDMYHKIPSKFSLWEPVVVGPIPGSEFRIISQLARQNIRTTSLTFKEFMVDIRNHRRFVASVDRQPLDKKALRR